MSIEIIPLVVEALHSLEARKLASRECNASTTRGIISILIVLVGSNYLMHIRGFAEFRKMCKQTQKLYVVSKHLNVLHEYVYTLHKL